MREGKRIARAITKTIGQESRQPRERGMPLIRMKRERPKERGTVRRGNLGRGVIWDGARS